MHVEPRYTRMSAMSNLFVRIRAGTDIAFRSGVVNYILENERWFDEYVKHYTNAPVIIREDFRDTEDLDGVFSGFYPKQRTYDTSSWEYAGMSVKEADAERGGTSGEQSGHGGQSAAPEYVEPPEEDQTLAHPCCVYSLL